VVLAVAGALEATFGREPVFRRNGGSIPVAEMFERLLGLTVVLMGFTNPDDNAHAPNESMVLANYETGIRTICLLWETLGEHGLGLSRRV
jgi:acetylornithine deacetylase/succinyl-diaminopimelate desuccinylase-like protein